MPERIQRKRTKGWRMPDNTVYVGRGSIWGNPCKIGDMVFMGSAHTGTGESKIGEATAFDCKRYFAMRVAKTMMDYPEKFIEPLRGKNLACWCALDQPCHADVLIKLANPTIERNG